MKAVYSEKRTEWHPLWKLMWIVTTPIWIAVAYMYPVTGDGKVGIIPEPLVAPTAFTVLFLVPELVSIRDRADRLPPLTHMIRGYVDDDFAFPAIYFLVGSVGGRWFGFQATRCIGLGVITAMLGWLTIHFTMSYLGPDPRPRETAIDAGLRARHVRRHLEL